jgi:hypothetical protein
MVEINDVIESAAEPQPEADLLDLVRQYGDARRSLAEVPSGPGAVAIGQRCDRLFARIEAEVQLLHGERDGVYAEAERAQSLCAQALGQRDEALAEVERLRKWLKRRTAIIDSQASEIAQVTRHAFDLTAQLREARDAAAPQQDGPPPVRIAQAHDFDGVPLWIHLCGEVDAFRNVPLDEPPHGGGCDRCDSGYPQPGDWRPLLAEPSLRPPGPAKPQQDGPVVLTLPEGAVALIGVDSGLRYARRSEFVWEADEADSSLMGLQQILHRERSVTVEMAPPPAPRTAAEIWAGLSEDEHAGFRMSAYAGLAEALDREAGRLES